MSSELYSMATRYRIKTSDIAAHFFSIISAFAQRSTLHGFGRIASSHQIKRRLLWLLISIGASTGFLSNFKQLIDRYFEKIVITNNIHDKAKFIFPDVTFCLTNPLYFRPNGTAEYDEMQRYIKEYSATVAANKHWPGKLADYLFVQRRDIYSHQPWSAIIKCSFQGYSCSAKSKSFEIRRLWPYGNCFTFNVSKHMSRTFDEEKLFRIGVAAPALVLIINKAASYPPDFKLQAHGFVMVSGVVVMIHEPETYPHIGTSFIVDGGVNIAVKVTNVTHANVKNKCQPNRKYYDYIDPFNNATMRTLGTPYDCTFDIKQETSVNVCKCLDHMRNPPLRFKDKPFCLKVLNYTGNSDPCINTIKYMEANDTNLHKKHKDCFQDFCTHYTYNYIISKSNFPAVSELNSYNDWANALGKLEEDELKYFNKKSDLRQKAILDYDKHNYSFEQLSKNDTLAAKYLNTHYVDTNFMFMQIQQASYFMDEIRESEELTLDRLLSAIGGCAGLWIGASIVSLFEFVDLLFDLTKLYGKCSLQTKKLHIANGNNIQLPQVQKIDVQNLFVNVSFDMPNQFHNVRGDKNSVLSKNCVSDTPLTSIV